MKKLIALLFVVALWAGEPTYRLRDVRWDPEEHILTWKVERGESVGEKFKKKGTDSYKIEFHRTLMTKKGGGSQPFSPEEAARVEQIFIMLVNGYAIESTEWFKDPRGYELRKQNPRLNGRDFPIAQEVRQ